MAAIDVALVKQLREKSGAGIMDCKEALSWCECNIIKAVEYLRKKGLAAMVPVHLNLWFKSV